MGSGGTLRRALKQVRMGHMDTCRKQADSIQFPDLSVITCVSLRKSPNFFTPVSSSVKWESCLLHRIKRLVFLIVTK